jgi:hypothetical protein
MLLDGSQSQQPLAGRNSDGSSSSEQTRSVNGNRSEERAVESNSKAASKTKDRTRKSKSKKRTSTKQLDQPSEKKQVKYSPPECFNQSTCSGVALRVITVKRVNRCVVRYCKCPRCGRTFKFVDSIDS